LLDEVITRLLDEEQFEMRGNIFIGTRDEVVKFWNYVNSKLGLEPGMNFFIKDGNFKFWLTESLEDSPFVIILIVDRLDEKTDEHGDQTGRVNIDKTTAIQEFIDMLESSVSHPRRPLEQELRRPKLMIPFKDEYQVDWLVKDFTSITRKDLAETASLHVDPRQQPRKEFNHPRDSVMAIIYAKKALELNLGGVISVFEIIKCLQCGEPIFWHEEIFKITCHFCSFEMIKIPRWCQCSHAGTDHKKMLFLAGCKKRHCNCTKFVYVQDRVPDEYDYKLR
jgi:hypothetical protein